MDPDLINNGAETRAAVALLTRSIRIVSAGDRPSQTFEQAGKIADNARTAGRPPHGAPATTSAPIPSSARASSRSRSRASNSRNMGQGGKMGHYPIHFHMARHVPADTFIKDSSINESMTRWIVLHSTQGVLLQRNIGYKSIGHGFYLESGTETDNKFYSNLGIFARAAVDNPQNPRKVPGILGYSRASIQTHHGMASRSLPPLPADAFPVANGLPASHGVLDQQWLERLHRQYGGRRRGLRRGLLVRPGLEQRHARCADRARIVEFKART